MPLIWGRVLMEGPNVVWYGDLFQEPITQKQKTGLFTSTRQIVGFRYHLGIQFALCRGPIDSIRRVWINDVEVFNGNTITDFEIDKPELFFDPVNDEGQDPYRIGGIQSTVEVYEGTKVQAVSQYLARFQDSGAGTTRTPNYTGTCYLVARELGGSPTTGRGAYLGTNTQIAPWKFEIERYPALFAGQSSSHNVIGVDANPANVLYEMLTNTEWGRGFPAADIDVGASSSFLTASNTLRTESNGFSMILDKKVDLGDMIEEVLRQIDGVLYVDRTTGKWTLKLARADYDINTVSQINNSNILAVEDFTRGSLEETTNQVVVRFKHRGNDYTDSYALAQDMANAIQLGGGTPSTAIINSVDVSYPGVKVPALAANLAWRDLRVQAYPLAKATFVLDNSLYATNIGDVLAWTTDDFDKLPMRVVSVDYGDSRDSRLTVSCIEDVFRFLDPSYGVPPDTGWSNPIVDMGQYPTDQIKVFEAPRAFIVREPNPTFGSAGVFGITGPEFTGKIFVAARRQGAESTILLRQRNSAGTPSGSYADAGTIAGFMRIGELSADMAAGTANPLSTFTVVPDPDTQIGIRTQFDTGLTADDLGVGLAHLILVGNEFMLVTSAADSGLNVVFQNTYRGVCDTGQEPHSAGDPVYLLFAGGGMTDTLLPQSNNVDLQLIMQSPFGQYSGTVTPVAIAMNARASRPYPPGAVLYNGSGTPFNTPSLEGAGSGLNGFRIDVDWWRRSNQSSNEVTSLLADEDPVWTTEYQVEVRADPDGANTLVGSVSAWTAGTGTIQVLRTDIITAAAAGTPLRVFIRARHGLLGGPPTLESLFRLQDDVTPTSSLTGQFYLGGGLGASVASNVYTAAATGTFTVNIGGAHSTSVVEAQVNGGGWSSVIGTGLTTGTFAATSGDLIELRRTVSEAPDPNFVELRNPSSVAVAYGTFG